LRYQNALKEFWASKLKFNWIFGLALIFILGIPRFIVVLRANVTGNFQLVIIIFLIMWVLPFILLNKKGRKLMGIRKVTNYGWLFFSFLLGIVCCLTVFWIGLSLFELSNGNWFVYISKSVTLSTPVIPKDQKLTYFLISAIMSMIFSPVGEELFYRGLVHGCFEEKFGENRASQIDSMAFAATHLAHFGIVFINGEWDFLIFPSLLWLVLMYFCSRVFFICKKMTGSLLGAILGHAAFNFTMMYLIFYHLII